MPKYFKNSNPCVDYSQFSVVPEYNSFSELIDIEYYETRDKYYYGEAKLFNHRIISEETNIEYNTLIKIMNGHQRTRKRDVIIAICITLKLNENKTNCALTLYHMMSLNPKDKRDIVIIEAISEKKTVSELNKMLIEYNLNKLDVTRSRVENDKHIPLQSSLYEEISVNIQPYFLDGTCSDLSLHKRYRCDRYDYHSEMIIRSKESGDKEYRITFEYGNYEIEIKNDREWKLLYSDLSIQQKYWKIKKCEDKELLNELSRLKEYTKNKAKYVHSICNDTRNYGSRFDAINDHGRFVIYGEGFGFYAPELCEYFQIEVSSTSCKFTVSDKSLFMKRYLGEEDWLKLYGETLPPVKYRFTTLDEVSNKQWRKEFQNLLNSARNLLLDIQHRKLFLFNVREEFNIDDLMQMFNVEEAFCCTKSEDGQYNYVPQKDFIIGSDGKEITIDDLCRAAELDIKSIEELCYIREKYGSLEQFLNIDVLTGQKGTENE